jgi:hypothetical protein
MTARVLFHEAAIAPAAMEEAVLRGASGLERLGVRQGDVVCILLHNSPAFLEGEARSAAAWRLLVPDQLALQGRRGGLDPARQRRDSAGHRSGASLAGRGRNPAELPVVADWSGFVEREGLVDGEARHPAR